MKIVAAFVSFAGRWVTWVGFLVSVCSNLEVILWFVCNAGLMTKLIRKDFWALTVYIKLQTRSFEISYFGLVQITWPQLYNLCKHLQLFCGFICLRIFARLYESAYIPIFYSWTAILNGDNLKWWTYQSSCKSSSTYISLFVLLKIPEAFCDFNLSLQYWEADPPWPCQGNRIKPE